MAGQDAVAMILLVAAVAAAAIGVCDGEVYRVGGKSGWTAINITVDYYKNWAASKHFKVGDTILFEYNNKFHNVIRVTHKNFNGCNTTSPYATWNTGNDSFTITRPSHFYFVCGIPGHCESGQKVDIRVPHARAPELSPSPSISGPSPIEPPPSVGPSASGPSIYGPSGSLPAPAPAPAPSPKKNGGSSAELSWKLLAVAVAAAVAAYH